MLEQVEEQRWVDYPTAQRYSGLSHTSLWRLVKGGEIRAARVGRSVRIDLRSLEQFMESKAEASA